MRRPSRHTMLDDALASPGIREVHDRLTALASAPVPEVGKTWQSLSGRLHERPASWSSRVNAGLRRPAAVFMATIVMSTGTAYAAHVGPVRSSVDWFVGSIASVLRPPGNSGKGVIPATGGEREASEDESDRGSEVVRGESSPSSTVEAGDDGDAVTDDRGQEGRSAGSTPGKSPKEQQREREDRKDEGDDGAEPDEDESDRSNGGVDEGDELEKEENAGSRGDRASKQGGSDAEEDEDPDEVDEDMGEHED